MNINMSESELKKKQISILAVGMLIYFLYGVRMSWSLFGSALIKENGWTELQASLPYSMSTMVAGVWAIIGGRLADKVAPKWLVIQGGLCTGIGLAIIGLSHNWFMVLLGAGVLLAMGSSISACLTATVIRWWPINKKGFANGLLTASTAFNSVLLTPVFNSLMLIIGMRRTCAFSGAIISIVICILALIFVKPAPEGLVKVTPEMIAEAEAEAAKKKQKVKKVFLSPYNDAPIHKIFASPQFYFWILMYFCACLSGQVATSQIGSIARSILVWPEGLTWLTVAITGLGNFSGRVLMSRLSDKVGPFRSFTLTFIIQVVICLLFPRFGGYFGMCLGIFAIGFGFGGAVAVNNVANAELWGKANIGTMYGLGALGYSLAGVVGPSVASIIRDTTGSYTIMFYGLAACAAVAIFFSEYLNHWADAKRNR